MHMSDEAFGDYAEKLEKEDFEDDVRNLSASLYTLTTAREDTILKLRASADYLDSIWYRYKSKLKKHEKLVVVQGDPNQSLLLQMAIALKICISDPKSIKPKCVLVA